MPLDITPKAVNKVMITDIVIKVGKYVQVSLSEGYDSENGFVSVEPVGSIYINGVDLVELVTTLTTGKDVYSEVRDILYSFIQGKGYIAADGASVSIVYPTTQARVDAEAGV